MSVKVQTCFTVTCDGCQSVYLHDYDLLDVRRWIVLSALGFLYRRAEKVTVARLLPEVTRRLKVGNGWEARTDSEVR